MRGSIRLPVAYGQFYSVFGGPYRAKPTTMHGVKMAAEIDLPCAVDVPTRDFSIPNTKLMVEGLRRGLALVLAGQPVYVGCAGGIGRTGLYLAIMAKAWGIENPVAFVRATYYGHAVETQEQQTYIANFTIPDDVKSLVRLAKLKSYFRPFGAKDRTVIAQIDV